MLDQWSINLGHLQFMIQSSQHCTISWWWGFLFPFDVRAISNDMSECNSAITFADKLILDWSLVVFVLNFRCFHPPQQLTITYSKKFVVALSWAFMRDTFHQKKSDKEKSDTFLSNFMGGCCVANGRYTPYPATHNGSHLNFGRRTFASSFRCCGDCL